MKHKRDISYIVFWATVYLLIAIVCGATAVVLSGCTLPEINLPTATTTTTTTTIPPVVEPEPEPEPTVTNAPPALLYPVPPYFVNGRFACVVGRPAWVKKVNNVWQVSVACKVNSVTLMDFGGVGTEDGETRPSWAFPDELYPNYPKIKLASFYDANGTLVETTTNEWVH
jgi:hypothetical protein